VTFDDSTSNTNVNISVANVNPELVIFNNNSQSYSVGGSFGITGTAA